MGRGPRPRTRVPHLALREPGARFGAGGGGASPDAPDVIFGASLHMWYRGDLGLSTSGGDVVSWADQSGNGRDLSAPGVGNAPSTSTPASLGGQTAVAFDASNAEFLEATGGAWGLSSVVVIAVVTQNSTGSAARVCDGSSAAQYSIAPLVGGGTTYNAQLGVTNFSSVSESTGAHVFAVTFVPAATMDFFVDDLSTNVYASGAAISASPASLDDLYLGARSGGGSQHWDGDIAEFLVTDASAFDASARASLATYINDRYGLS